MSVNWKAILSLFIVFAIVGLLIFSPKGQKIVGNRTAPIGSFIKTISGKVTKSGITETKTLDVTLTDVSPSSLGDLEFQIKGDRFQGKLEYELISLLDSSVNFDEREVDVQTGGLTGTVSFFRNGNMKITGKTNSLKINSMNLEKQDTNFLITGKPISYDLPNINEKKLEFSYISGSLKWSGLSGIAPMLSNDQLELINFDGSIKQSNELVTITGKVDKIILNGVEISKT